MSTYKRFFYFLLFSFALFLMVRFGKGSSITAKPNMRELDWSGKNMQQLSEAFGEEYPNLERLYLSDNRINGLPLGISGLDKLKELSLSHNAMTQLPQEVSTIPNLEILDVSRNHFSELPASILKMKNLKILDLRQNDMKDLPEEIKGMEQLQTVYIYGNPFTSEARNRFREWLPNTKFVWFDPTAKVE